MRNVGLAFAAISFAHLAYVLLHLDLFPTTFPVSRGSVFTACCAVSSVIFGTSGWSFLREVRRCQRSK